jgi:hypothetical protein
MSHGPARWGWGISKVRDHFTYHSSKTVFWYKNDGPFAEAMLFFHGWMFISTFFTYLYWITLVRRIFATKEVPTTLVTYTVAALRQYFYFSMLLYILVLISYFINYARFPLEASWAVSRRSWLVCVFDVIRDYFIWSYNLLFR